MLKKLFLIFTFLTSLTACEQNTTTSNEPTVTENASQKHPTLDKIKVAKPSLRTWQQIQKSGFITAIKLDRENEAALPRSGSTSIYHQQLFTLFAQEHNLEVKWLTVSNLPEMFEHLEKFNADIIPRHLTITENRRDNFSFTYPLLRDKEVLIGALTAQSPTSEDNISITLPASSAYSETLSKYYPNWTITYLTDSLNSEQLADEIVKGTFNYSVIDGFAFDTLKQYRDDIKLLLPLPDGIDLAWMINLNNPTLLHKLNNFISEHHVVQIAEPNRKFDFKTLQKKKLPLRVITRNSPETYFLWRGELLGFEYELMRRFASLHNLKLEMVVADSYDEMLTMLKEGRGDMIAAGLTRTKTSLSKIKQQKMQTSIRYNRVSELLVAHKDSPVIKELADLKGRTITVRKTSSFWHTAQQLVKDYQVKLIAADELLATELLIAQVADKSIDLTIADSNLVAIERNFRKEITIPLTLEDDVPYAYVVRNNNPELLNFLNEFIRKHYRQTFYNVVKNKYFKNTTHQKKVIASRLKSGSELSPYDEIVKSNVTEYNFDWRLIVSQMYQESRFDPLASNPTGAKGLMQMLPRTAKELGVTNLTEPEQAISSGIRYLNWTRDRFSKDLPVQEQIFFSLASYNAGFGHVKDAQRLARQLGFRDDKWFNHVEKAMLLLQKRQYYKKARFGYVRGSEPVNYVRNIHQRYLSYIRITQ
ncbi:MAG: transporter substrate-binding domain-containing protein [Colwellia sp.]|nr:transporter substrate-binding domain-containing protein [Colwellia sp.]